MILHVWYPKLVNKTVKMAFILVSLIFNDDDSLLAEVGVLYLHDIRNNPIKCSHFAPAYASIRLSRDKNAV